MYVYVGGGDPVFRKDFPPWRGQENREEKGRQEEELFLLSSFFPELFSDSEMPGAAKPINVIKWCWAVNKGKSLGFWWCRGAGQSTSNCSLDFLSGTQWPW